MPEKQSEADKARAAAAIRRIATLRAARLARDAALPPIHKKPSRIRSSVYAPPPFEH